MVIKPTGPPKLDFVEPQQRAERAPFKPDAARTDPTSAPQTSDGPPTISRADLSDPQKAEQVLQQCLSEVLQEASRNMGVPVSDSQQQALLNVLGNDPVMREKLLRYLDQVAK